LKQHTCKDFFTYQQSLMAQYYAVSLWTYHKNSYPLLRLPKTSILV